MADRDCPDCVPPVSRRSFLQAAAAVAGGVPLFATAKATAAPPTKTSAPETAVKVLFDSLSEKQKKEVCFPWDHTDAKLGLLRTRVSANWQITKPTITGGDFYTKSQQGIIHDIFKGLVNPEWYARFQKQLKDDSGGRPWGAVQSIAIFGQPGTDQFEFVLTGRHQTLRADGNCEPHVAFGGPVFYGHSAGENTDQPQNHPGNVFWPQAQAANKVYQMLDEKQRAKALIAKAPKESAVVFRGKKIAEAPGLAAADMSKDQLAELRKVLACMIEPFRVEDRDEVLDCMKAQGGLEKCKLSFYEDADIAKDKVWDNWRLEGPAFVWYFRGDPHVHVWVNVADSPEVKLNS
ncbi:MAG TPA: DUF3500 domain-containing protein [Fimbriiglobus sp.]|jgi:hypothetical protein